MKIVSMGKTLGLLLIACAMNSLEAQIADGKCRFLGNITGNTVPANFAQYWNQITPENAGKWGSVESARDVMSWSALDNSYNFAAAQGFPFKQHTFVWNNQQPSWLSGLTAAEIEEEVDEWIRLFCERYPNTDMIDVVNEPMRAPAFYSIALGGSGTTGYDWVITAFEKAREHCPNAKLLLNEYNIINSTQATNTYLTIINLLKTRELIDGIGVQAHYFEIGNATLETLTTNLDKLAETGLPIYLSEVEIDVANDQDQKTAYETLFPVLWEHPGVHGITLWGYRQGEMWKENGYLVRSNNTERPAMTWLKSYLPTAPGGVFCMNVGLEQNSSPARVYPTLMRDGMLTIEGVGITEVEIRDVTGRPVVTRRSSPSDKVEVQVSLPHGAYIVMVESLHVQSATRLLVVGH